MKARLLIVDDDANTLASLSRAFRLAGHEATVCDNPVKALEIIRQEKFDLIFSDVMMPVKDGLQLLEEIRAAGSAALGNFDDACKAQRTALGMAKTLGWDTAAQQARLDAYTHKQAWRGSFFAP